MRIVLVTGDFATPLQPTRGMFNVQMARALARHHDVVVIAHVSWRDEWRLGRRGTRIERARSMDGMDVRHPRYYYTPGMWRTQYGSFLWHSVAASLRDVFAAARPDVVMGYWLHPDGEVALRAARMAGVPGVVMSGGSDLLVHARDAARRRRIQNVLTGADAVVCVSEHLARAAVTLGAAPPAVHVVRRGVDLERFRPGDRAEARRALGLDPGRAALVWVGRLVPVKGLDVLIDACATLQARGLDFTLHLLGSGPLRQALTDQAQRVGVAGRVSFAGVVPHEKLADWYRAADLSVLPSRSEGIPNVLLESIACGTPFVASDVGGVSEIADAARDRLVPPDNAPALAAAIADALGASSTASRRFLPLSWDESAAGLERVFASAAARHASRQEIRSRSGRGTHGS